MTTRSLSSLSVNLLVAAFYADFALAHWQAVVMSGRWFSIGPFALQETLLALMFLVRQQAVLTSPWPTDWAVAIAGSLLPLCIRPGAYWPQAAPLGHGLQFAGLAVSIGALLSLRRSMGIVAAIRPVRTGGLYRWVRHPMYAGHLATLSGYVLLYPSWRTATLVAGTVWCLFQRMRAEENLLALARDTYWNYMQRVKWRLVPHVY